MNLPEYSTEDFTYSNHKFVAEASDLGWPVGQRPGSLVLRNPKTGNKVTFLLESGRDEEFDGEVNVYVSQLGAVARNPRLTGVEVHVLND
jgi:hypothetical protein